MSIKNMIAHILISVQDLEESRKFFRDVIGMRVVAEHLLNSKTINTLWNLNTSRPSKVVFLKNEEQPTLLTLIEFSSYLGSFIRDDANIYDYGLFDVAFRAKNIDSIYTKLRETGYQFLSSPVIYTADWAKVTVKEVILIGPNKMPIALIERLSEPKPVIIGDFGTMVDSAQFVEDVDLVAPYYIEILGLNKVFDSWLPKGLINEVVALPFGVDSRMAFLVKPGVQSPAVELIQCSIRGKYINAHPPQIGLFALSWETDNLNELIEKIKVKGYPSPGPVAEMEFGIHGKVRMTTAEGPNKVLFQFFEKI